MSINSKAVDAFQNLVTALSSAMNEPVQETSTPATSTGFEDVSAPADNGLNTKIYLRSQAQEIPAELVGNITYGELVSKYFDIGDSYSVTITKDETSQTVSPEDVYGSGVSTIIVTEQTASLG